MRFQLKTQNGEIKNHVYRHHHCLQKCNQSGCVAKNFQSGNLRHFNQNYQGGLRG